MDLINKSITSSFKNLSPYTESLCKNYSERDIFHISNKFLSSLEWDTISNLLTKSLNFHTVSISGVSIDSYGLRKLSEILSVNKYLKTVKLDWNYLNEYNEDFDCLCEVLSKANNIVYLHLNNNKLNSTHVASLCKVLRGNNVLLQMDLRWNEIGNEGAREIANALANNNVVQEVNLTGNSVSQEILFEINEKLNRNKNFFYNVNFKKEATRISSLNEMINTTNTPPDRVSYVQFFREKENITTDKERELTSEYKARYDSQLMNNANLEKKNKELEILLKNDKARYDDFKAQITKELQFEKDKIVQYEDQILKSREESMKKEFEWRKLIGESEKEISNLIQDKNDLLIENNILKEQMNKQIACYEEKYRMLEEQLNKNSAYLENNCSSLKIENESFRKDFEEIIRNNNKEWEKKNKNTEENLKILKSAKEAAEKENSLVKRELSDFKLSRDLEIRERESRILAEETRKLDIIIKKYETKFRTFEITKNELNEKNYKLLLEIDSLRKSLLEETSNNERNLDIVTNERNNLIKNLNNVTHVLNKSNAEVSIKEALINKLKSEMNSLNITVQNNFNESNSRLEGLKSEYVKEKHEWEKQRQDLIIKCDNLENTYQELKAKLLNKENEKISYLENLKKEVSKHIEDKFKEKYKI